VAKEYTKCVEPSSHIGGAVAQAIIVAAGAALGIGFALGWVPGVLAGVFAALIAYCRWWLYDRLVCLDGEVCAVGWVHRIEEPGEKTGLDAFDTDYSISIVLAPHLLNEGYSVVEIDGLQGSLIAKPSAVSVNNWDWQPKKANERDENTAILHCEFEGGGVWDLLQMALTMLPATIVVAGLCAIPVFGWVLCIVGTIVIAAIVAASIAKALGDVGDPHDVNPDLPELHEGADIVIVKGVWVYDSAHQGWNEIHPVRHCQKVASWTGSWTDTGFERPDTMATVSRFCQAINDATGTATQALQKRPENQWMIDPRIDGCRPRE
jgi:hypothetical protein